MPPEPGSPRDWLRHAESDLLIASIPNRGGIFLNQLCFHTQQCIEKSLKALLLFSSLEFPRTHNITVLIEILSDSREIPDFVRQSAITTEYAVEARYPSDMEEITEKEYLEAVRLARQVLGWATGILDSVM